MQEDRHTGNTAGRIITPCLFFGSQRPKIWLRRAGNPRVKAAIREYILNRGTQAEQVSLENLRAAIGGE